LNANPTTAKVPYEPSLPLRLLLWFGLYFGAQLPLIPYRQDWAWFPLGLLGPFVYLLNKITGAEIALPMWTLRVLYIGYALHLIASLVVRRRKTFQLLIWILLVLVIFNLGGCEMDQHLH
jgi:hypothetical protein